MQRKIFFIGNWKMYLRDVDSAKDLFSFYVKCAKKYSKVFFGAAPSHAHIFSLSSRAFPKNLLLGAQGMSAYPEGAHTGESSVFQLKDAGAEFVILGHSEERAEGESSEDVSRKVQLALKAGLVPVVCVGEKERDYAGEYWNVLRDEIKSSLDGIPKNSLGKIILAYEPVWAVGEKASSAMSPASLFETIIFIRKVLADMFGNAPAHQARIIYGGSVDSSNAQELLSAGSAQGFLVGRASIRAQEMTRIMESLFPAAKRK